MDIALRNIIGKKQVPKDTLEVLSECEKIGTKNLAALYEISQSNIINDQSPAAKIVLKYFGEDMHCFLIHDALNIPSMFYHYRELCKWVQEGFVSYYQAKIDPKLIVETAENINQHSLAIIKLFKYPWQLLTYLARSHLGQEVRPVSVNLMSSLEEAATVISGRFFYRVSHDKNPNSPLKKSISIQGQDVNIWCYQGIIESVLYNNIKNSVKKFEAEEESLTPSDKTEPLGDITKYLATISKERVAYGSCFSLNDDYATLVFSDSGSPMNISSLISKLRKRMLKEPHNMIDWVSPQMRKHFENWSENDFAWNLITLEDVANIAFMARIRGSDIPQTIVGGMGLYGVKCLLEHVGGAILYTTTYKEETPMFIYIIPKYPTKSKEEAQSIRTGFINGAIKVG